MFFGMGRRSWSLIFLRHSFFVSSVSLSMSKKSLPSAPMPPRPVSSERSAFCRASLNVRPNDIASPTDFICTPRCSSTPLNFSKSQRGIFTTV